MAPLESKFSRQSELNHSQKFKTTGQGCIKISPVHRLALLLVVNAVLDASIRQRIFFPDRKLVQYDSGKLQTLCRLLRERKAGGHKCLIFTQMSKMLDILEIFLNLNGHSYVRLDGGTGVEKRQKLMVLAPIR